MLSRIPVNCLSLAYVVGIALFVETASASGQTQGVDSSREVSAAASFSPEPANPILGTGTRVHWMWNCARAITVPALAWYHETAPRERIAWGALAACGGLGLWVLAERMVRLRGRKVIPVDFAFRFINSIHDGKLDCGQALDHCERHSSPAARVALAALRRWGRPSNDLERAVGLATRVECDRLRRNVSTLRRIAALAPLIGLMGTLSALGGMLDQTTPGPLSAGGANSSSVVTIAAKAGPISSAALSPLTVGVIIAVIALVAYDGLSTRVEKLSGALERLGAETIDAIALMTPRPAIRPIHVAARVPNAPSATSTDEPHRDRGQHPVIRNSIKGTSKPKRD